MEGSARTSTCLSKTARDGCPKSNGAGKSSLQGATRSGRLSQCEVADVSKTKKLSPNERPVRGTGQRCRKINWRAAEDRTKKRSRCTALGRGDQQGNSKSSYFLHPVSTIGLQQSRREEKTKKIRKRRPGPSNCGRPLERPQRNREIYYQVTIQPVRNERVTRSAVHLPKVDPRT